MPVVDVTLAGEISLQPWPMGSHFGTRTLLSKEMCSTNKFDNIIYDMYCMAYGLVLRWCKEKHLLISLIRNGLFVRTEFND